MSGDGDDLYGTVLDRILRGEVVDLDRVLAERPGLPAEERARLERLVVSSSTR